MTSSYITTTIPYVNARPHLGFALELVQADVLARYHRSVGEQVRLQAGTDDNALKNVLAAAAAGVGVQEFVDANAAAFTGLAEPLSLSVDDLIRTSSDPRHRAGVERLWRACAGRGDLYRRRYEGLYCVGCEQFYTTAELNEGRCPEHRTVPDLVSEENWFFRLSRYAGQLRGLIADGAIRIEPAERRNEVLALIDAGLADFSVSRGIERARGWGTGRGRRLHGRPPRRPPRRPGQRRARQRLRQPRQPGRLHDPPVLRRACTARDGRRTR
jgi:methionyl-tRNA synthetase